MKRSNMFHPIVILAAGCVTALGQVFTAPNGFVGVGTERPTRRLAVAGVGGGVGVTDNGDKSATLLLASRAGSGGEGGCLEFGFGYESYGQPHFAAIKGWGANGSGKTVGDLVVFTRPNTSASSLSEVIRFTYQGTVEVAQTLNVRGDTRTSRLTITGGSDVAELFPGAEGIEPGMVVCADTAKPGGLRLTEEAYDRAVLGIVSGANGLQPGMVLSQPDALPSGDYPVAAAGRVYCWCDAAYGVIAPGTALTTAPTRGHAMAVEDISQARGAVIGKALSSLSEGRGLVLVWVTHQ